MPDNVRVQGSLLSAQKQIGNAVPSLLGEVLGRAIRAQLLGSPAMGRLKLMPNRIDDVPAPERPKRVPSQYLAREGKHSAHPGTGQGHGAIARASAG